MLTVLSLEARSSFTMHIHILGICGTFMGSVALLARELGYRVTGVDQQVYPPMSTQLEDAGIELFEGYAQHGLDVLQPDVVVIGNALSRGNPAVEFVLDNKLYYQSGPQWIAEHVLRDKKVIAVSGTHGKTTTASMLAWVFESADAQPGFLIGGVPVNFSGSARLGQGEYFVIEADEYDCAFFDKRSKFLHYRPDTLIINNLEFDHADIFPDLSAIQRQFHHLVRTVPANGHILMPTQSALEDVMAMGCWSSLDYLSGPNSAWHITDISADDASFSICRMATTDEVGIESEELLERGVICWTLSGEHNRQNALAAVAAARLAGISVANACAALSCFQNVKRRMELMGEVNRVQIYDDFAHHPTAIELTLEGARRKFPDRRIFAVIEARSNTMRMGVHNSRLAEAVATADAVWWCAPESEAAAIFDTSDNVHLIDDVDEIVASVAAKVRAEDVIIVMSNGSFAGIHAKLLAALAS